ncbi:cyclopropane-fatty-acyl-phospholipid synthase family protein [Burkholderiaceae bacterium DAT-1]|nr:cyclopropane-fatty-acyl-phospholipid synthase family protein [Burkholderiaceae bacterium DAT-1]
MPERVPMAGRLFIAALSRMKVGHVSVTTPEGHQLTFGDLHAQPAASLTIHDWGACKRILVAGDIGFAEAWRARWIDTPNLTDLLKLAIRNESALEGLVSGKRLASIWYAILHAFRRNTKRGSQRNIHAHYDLGNDFYKLWLDPSWTYSSAIFNGRFDQSLEAAQGAKYQRIIDQLGLKPGMRVLEIGCGWGGFALHAARQGIQVHGITISRAQFDIATKRIADAHLTHFASFELRDYRDLDGSWDAIVSIEMFEAVGESYWKTYFRKVHDLLRPGRQALIQSITIGESRFASYRASSDFIREYIFPGGMLPSPERFIATAASAGLQTHDNFAFGPDYAETLRRWRHDVDTHAQQIASLGFDDAFMRIWQLYLCYCEAGFDEGRTDVNQFLLTRTEHTS